MQSTYYIDKELEELFCMWLDKYLYKYFSIEGFYGFKRIQNIDEQKKGIDVEFNIGEEIFYIDEKATLHYINRNISTFAFELMNRKSGL